MILCFSLFFNFHAVQVDIIHGNLFQKREYCSYWSTKDNFFTKYFNFKTTLNQYSLFRLKQLPICINAPAQQPTTYAALYRALLCSGVII